MKFALLLVAICMVLCLASGIENNTGRRLVNRPKFDIYGHRQKRSAVEGVKGGVRVHPLFEFPRRKPDLSVRKGEYICGNKVCKLEPGVVPKNCNGMCQYPILPKLNDN
ncbi:unnamed protein product [Arctia plantaginis]|uniref:Uncharacterized protein n=1 Tax=Arctia plantaginis TaxID=874455 RepID=A0A8S0Z8K6_ARCPL|nr:unnamed protein product [Arctia plantaginis]CAB3232379.1 unnamed protein product [Arctia plantaginis]